jgi:GT2 family glycosyltransferase
MIGIGITSYLRTSDSKCIERIISFAPEGAKVVIVKDVKGISVAKNRCLAELDECEHIFLFDSDTYPLVRDWHLPYINSGEAHLCYTFNRNIVKKENGLIHHELPNGCLLYLKKECLEAVGGFDEKFEGYSYEHVDFSRRIFNAGLTSWPFMDVEGSEKLIYAMDRKHEVKSSVHPRDRRYFMSINKKRYIEQRESREWMPYK